MLSLVLAALPGPLAIFTGVELEKTAKESRWEGGNKWEGRREQRRGKRKRKISALLG